MLSNIFLRIAAAENDASGITVKYGYIIFAACIIVLLLAEAIYLFLTCRQLSKRLRSGSGISRSKGDITAIEVGKLHEQGMREYQQDSFGVSDSALLNSHGILAVVADGMGGLSNGDKVSQCAVEEILDGFLACSETSDPEPALLLLARQAVKRVNVYLGEENYRTSGSTLVMGLIKNNALSFLSMGDSRICLFRDGVLYQLNREHVYKNELAIKAVNEEITLTDVYTASNGSGLTSYLGMGSVSHIDYPASPIRLYPGDKIMLMSDGVYNALTEEELTSALKLNPSEAVDILRSAITKKAFSNQDNYTGIILECRAGAVKRAEPVKKHKSQTIIPS